MPKRKMPGLNTASMADISFLLLSFFFLTSQMNSADQGIQRKLPPPLKGNEEPPPVNKRNVLKIRVNMYDQLLVNDELMADVRDLKAYTKEFIANPTHNPQMSLTERRYIEELGQEAVVSRGIVSLQSDRGTSYKMYIAVQNQLAAAFNELRNEYARQNFGKNVDNLTEKQKIGVQKVVPISISEAEPSDYGGEK